MSRLFISAGDPSGDLLASLLARQIKKQRPGAEIWAIGGPELARIADYFLEDLASRGLMGVFEPVRRLPELIRLRSTIARVFGQHHFDAVIPVDYYGFNIRLAQLAKAKRIPVAYYVSPQVWASRAGRVKQLRRYVDQILCLFPFEVDFYHRHGVNAVFAGHPLAQELFEIRRKQHVAPAASDGHDPAAPMIGLLPGSRPDEIKRHMPVLTQVWSQIRAEFPKAHGALFQRHDLADLYPSAASLKAAGIEAIRGPAFDERARLTLAISASGLACLENMMLGVPMVIFYGVKPAWLYALARGFLVKTRHIGMPNILAGEELVQEIAWGMTSEKNSKATQYLVHHSIELLRNPAHLEKLQKSLCSLAETLIPNGKTPLEAATEAVFEIFDHD
ncbi:MAG: hypothetical protein HY547_05490 [Elusimicrobia bacterium]|nr:hypothetical protein [Elusimicrobiota bacterium]